MNSTTHWYPKRGSRKKRYQKPQLTKDLNGHNYRNRKEHPLIHGRYYLFRKKGLKITGQVTKQDGWFISLKDVAVVETQDIKETCRTGLVDELTAHPDTSLFGYDTASLMEVKPKPKAQCAVA